MMPGDGGEGCLSPILPLHQANMRLILALLCSSKVSPEIVEEVVKGSGQTAVTPLHSLLTPNQPIFSALST